KQVRDALFVQDLVDGFEAAINKIDVSRGQVYNVGGGVGNQLSLLELIAYLERFSGKKVKVSFADWRPGDQPVFVSNIAKIKRDLGWEPKTSLEQGIHLLYDWIKAHEPMFRKMHCM